MKHKNILSKFSNARIAVFGDVMIDHYIYGRIVRQSAEADIPIIKVDRTEEMPGGAASVAIMVSGFGAYCRLYGASVNQRCRKNRVIIDGKQYARFDEDAYAQLSQSEYDEHIEAFKRLSFDAVIFSDYDKGYLSEYLVDEIMSICSKRGIYVAVDPKPATIARYNGADLIKPNMKEAIEITGMTDPQECCYEIENMYAHEKSVLLTDAGNGMWMDGITHINGINPDVVDVTGCGDMAISAFTLAHVAGACDADAALIANCAAAIETEKIGCRPVSVQELKKRLDKVYCKR